MMSSFPFTFEQLNAEKFLFKINICIVQWNGCVWCWFFSKWSTVIASEQQDKFHSVLVDFLFRLWKRFFPMMRRNELIDLNSDVHKFENYSHFVRSHLESAREVETNDLNTNSNIFYCV